MNTTTASKSKIVSAGMSVLLAATLACSYALAEGTAEKAGQQIDQTAEQAAQAAADAKASASQKAQTGGEYLDDAAITAKIKLAILRDPALKVFQISVTTTDGAVKLTGTVDSQESIDRATIVAKDAHNVKSVENALTVKGAS
jgi:hyperosmotically inducible periplasmic protein